MTHPDVSEHLWSGHLAAGMQRAKQEGGPELENHFEDYFDLCHLVEQQAVSIGPFSISFHAATHSLPTMAVFVEAAGRKFSYSADTAYNPRLIEWLARADMIVHEANGGYPHTPYQRLAELPLALRQKIRVVHYPDGFDPPGREVELSRQGQSYWV